MNPEQPIPMFNLIQSANQLASQKDFTMEGVHKLSSCCSHYWNPKISSGISLMTDIDLHAHKEALCLSCFWEAKRMLFSHTLNHFAENFCKSEKWPVVVDLTYPIQLLPLRLPSLVSKSKELILPGQVENLTGLILDRLVIQDVDAEFFAQQLDAGVIHVKQLEMSFSYNSPKKASTLKRLFARFQGVKKLTLEKLELFPYSLKKGHQLFPEVTELTLKRCQLSTKKSLTSRFFPRLEKLTVTNCTNWDCFLDSQRKRLLSLTIVGGPIPHKVWKQPQLLMLDIKGVNYYQGNDEFNFCQLRNLKKVVLQPWGDFLNSPMNPSLLLCEQLEEIYFGEERLEVDMSECRKAFDDAESKAILAGVAERIPEVLNSCFAMEVLVYLLAGRTLATEKFLLEAFRSYERFSFPEQDENM